MMDSKSLYTTRVQFPAGTMKGFLLFVIASRSALGPAQSPIQLVQEALSTGVKLPGREADHSPPFSAEVKECVSDTSTRPIRLHAVVLS
jgi:hypothetical protein